MKWHASYSSLIVIGLFLLSIACVNIFAGGLASSQQVGSKPRILYFDYLEQPFVPSDFSRILSFASSHGFNTLMVVVYIGGAQIFNDSTLLYFYSLATERGIKFVPSFYIASMNDTIDAKGFSWVNLDMERMTESMQLFYYNNISRFVPLVSVTMPYSSPQSFYTRMLIVETYAGTPAFWFDQMAYSHSGTICSVHVGDVHSEVEYRSEFYYCLEYSGGVMVFDYPQLAKSGYY